MKEFIRLFALIALISGVATVSSVVSWKLRGVRDARIAESKSIALNPSTNLVEKVVNEDGDEFAELWAVRAWAGSPNYPMAYVYYEDESDNGDANVISVELSPLAHNDSRFVFEFVGSKADSDSSYTRTIWSDDTGKEFVIHTDLNLDGRFDLLSVPEDNFIMYQGRWTRFPKQDIGSRILEIETDDGKFVRVTFENGEWVAAGPDDEL